MNYAKNKKYLTAGGKLLLNILGGLFCFICLTYLLMAMTYRTGLFALPGLIFGAIGAILLYSQASGMTDEEYDFECSNYMAGLDIKNRALNTLGIDIDEVKEIEPIQLEGFCFDGCQHVKLGKDNKWRTNKYEKVMLFFSANEVHVYTYQFNTVQEQKMEKTDVYFYNDIVTVSSSTEAKEIRIASLKPTNVEYECFKLITAGGNSLSVAIKDSSDAQRSINAMRQLLRQKKQG